MTLNTRPNDPALSTVFEAYAALEAGLPHIAKQALEDQIKTSLFDDFRKGTDLSQVAWQSVFNRAGGMNVFQYDEEFLPSRGFDQRAKGLPVAVSETAERPLGESGSAQAASLGDLPETSQSESALKKGADSAPFSEPLGAAEKGKVPSPPKTSMVDLIVESVAEAEQDWRQKQSLRPIQPEDIRLAGVCPAPQEVKPVTVGELQGKWAELNANRKHGLNLATPAQPKAVIRSVINQKLSELQKTMNVYNISKIMGFPSQAQMLSFMQGSSDYMTTKWADHLAQLLGPEILA